jgi:Na+/H+ antiporter NhaD/arsenite permease-like protein
VIVGVTAKTGVFEYVAVRLYKQSEGNPFKLLVLICCLDIVLSAFLDNVTTMLLLGPVCVQLWYVCCTVLYYECTPLR